MSIGEWWDIPGPSRFLDKAWELADEHRIVGIAAPNDLKAELAAALSDRFLVLERARAYEIDAQRIGRRAVMQAIAKRIPSSAGRRIQTASDFLDIPRLTNRAFVVRNLDDEIWRMWTMFARDLRRAAGEALELIPRMALMLPSDLPDRAYWATVSRKAVHKWVGTIDRVDCAIWHDRTRGTHADVISRLARETSIEIAGPNTTLFQGLVALDLRSQVDPWEELRKYAPMANRNRQVCWRDGLVDEWDDAPRVDSLVLAARGQRADFEKRAWRAHCSVVFPYIEEIRAMIVRRHRPFLETKMPWANHHHNPPRVRESASEIDLTELKAVLGPRLSHDERELINHAVYKVRHRLAHMLPLSFDDVEKLAYLWDGLTAPPVELGWNWPQRGQRLIIMIGPPAAGKSTYVQKHYPPEIVVSSDAIREEFPELAGAEHGTKVFRIVRQRVLELLRDGSSAVIDATHLKAQHREVSRSIVPEWVGIDYVVVDRPLEDKIRDGGWRLDERADMITEGHERFQLGKEAIKAGDGDSRVSIRLMLEDGNCQRKEKAAPMRRAI